MLLTHHSSLDLISWTFFSWLNVDSILSIHISRLRKRSLMLHYSVLWALLWILSQRIENLFLFFFPKLLLCISQLLSHISESLIIDRVRVWNKSRIQYKLIIKLSFELTFWIWPDSKLSCLHFQLNSSLIRFSLTENYQQAKMIAS